LEEESTEETAELLLGLEKEVTADMVAESTEEVDRRIMEDVRVCFYNTL